MNRHSGYVLGHFPAKWERQSIPVFAIEIRELVRQMVNSRAHEASALIGGGTANGSFDATIAPWHLQMKYPLIEYD